MLSTQSVASLPPADVSPRAAARTDWLDRDEIYSAPQHILSSHGRVSKEDRERDREEKRGKSVAMKITSRKWPHSNTQSKSGHVVNCGC